MTPAAVVEKARRTGVTLFAEGGRLKFETDSGPLSPDLRILLTEHKEAVLAHLDASGGDLTADERHLLVLVDRVADAQGFTPEERTEAKSRALADREAAFECFSALVAELGARGESAPQTDSQRRRDRRCKDDHRHCGA